MTDPSPKKRGNRPWTDAQWRAAGRVRLSLRPTVRTLRDLRLLAERSDCSCDEVVAHLVASAMASLVST